jgi:zinc transport system permease protein
MTVVAALIAVLAVSLGLGASWFWDTPAGPSVVVAAVLLFAFTQSLPVRR